MKKLPEFEQHSQDRANRKRPTTDSKRLGAAIMASIRRLDALNLQLEALSRRGAR